MSNDAGVPWSRAATDQFATRRSTAQSPVRTGRSTGRAASSVEHQAILASRLTTRDKWLLALLLEHRVLTTGQIQDSFASPMTLSFWQLPSFIHTLEKAGFSA